MIAAALAAFAPFLLGTEDDRDRLVLQDGKELRGRALVDAKDRVLFAERGKERWIPVSQIRSLDSVSRRMKKFLDESAALDDEDAAGRLALAERMLLEYCRPGARLEAWRVLAADPRNDRAHEILGHKKRGGEWLLPLGQEWITLADARRIRSDWGKAWELESEHYAFRTNREIFEAAKLAQDLERFYLQVIRLLAPAEAHEILAPFSVYAFREAKDFPKIAGSIAGYFQRGEARAYLLLPDQDLPPIVFHEMAHGILFHAISHKKEGAIPTWADEGLAEYFSHCVQGRPGRIRFEEGTRHEPYFQALRSEAELFGFKGMLNFSANDFLSSTKRDLRYAQVYGWVYWLLHGQEGKMRDGFAAFLRECPRGAASPTKLFSCLGQSADALESRWLAYLGR